MKGVDFTKNIRTDLYLPPEAYTCRDQEFVVLNIEPSVINEIQIMNIPIDNSNDNPILLLNTNILTLLIRIVDTKSSNYKLFVKLSNSNI